MNRTAASLVLSMAIAAFAAMITAPGSTAGYTDTDTGSVRIGITNDPAKFPRPVELTAEPSEGPSTDTEGAIQ